MDQTQLQEKIALYYQKLPEETKVLFASMNWLETLKEIDAKYSLNDEQIKTLGTETTILLLGMVSPEDYEQTLKTEIKLEGGKTDEIIKEINEKILKDISPKLFEAFNNNIVELADEKYGEGFTEKFSKLPEEIQNAVNDSGYQASIYSIGNKYGLGIDKIGELEDITTKVLLGSIKSGDYESEVKNKIGLPEDKNKEMVVLLNDRIFKNIKDKMVNSTSRSGAPLPPYAMASSKQNVISIKEEKKEPMVVKTLDIETNKTEKPLSIPIVENKVSDVVKPNIMANKLMGSTISSATVTDYSMPKMGGGSHDPYHEEI